MVNKSTAAGVSALSILAAAVAVGMQSDDPGTVKVALFVAGFVAAIYAAAQVWRKA